MDSYKTIKKEACDEFFEKHSKFIGFIKPVKTEDEAIEFINSKREQYWDATHNVYAYILRQNNIMRYSDDGEPQGTAGIPALDILKKNNITDVVVVVTRYFGGIMLGAGGLVRAYSRATKIALEAGDIISMYLCSKLEIVCPYSDYGKIMSSVASFKGKIEKETFLDSVNIVLYINKNDLIKFSKCIMEITSGRVNPRILGEEFVDMYL